MNEELRNWSPALIPMAHHIDADRVTFHRSNSYDGPALRELTEKLKASLVPADDGEPITEERLTRFGFTKALNGPTRWYSDWLTLRPGGKGAWAAWSAMADSDRQPCLVVLLTIGDLRRLAAALGLTLGEGRE